MYKIMPPPVECPPLIECSFGREHRATRMYFLLELGGKTLEDYFYQKVLERHGNLNTSSKKMEHLLLTNILKGAAQALQQFHRYGIHFDVKENNFLVALDENQSEPNPDFESNETILCKLIDFNFSVISERRHFVHTEQMLAGIKAPELLNNLRPPTDKADVWSFGLMAFRLFHKEYYLRMTYEDLMNNILHPYMENSNYNGYLDQLIKNT
uniref:Protein kinase domain-containing protein n=1 Tax=Meloidogyne incognita TaxID=6306 RepID=A0A914L1H0_MELIC